MANDNAPGQVVISGRLQALEAAGEPMRAAGAKRVVRLPVSGAFHSPLMAEIVDDLATAFDAEDWRDARVPIVSNVSAEPLTEAGPIRRLLAEQVRSPVEWVRSVARMEAEGIDLAIECGPGSTLTGMVKRIAPGIRTATVGDAATRDAAVELLRAGVPASASA
jgi:[acyl-carrier-protein] S-malonyltransferase